jgi:hypothetical protein
MKIVSISASNVILKLNLIYEFPEVIMDTLPGQDRQTDKDPKQEKNPFFRIPCDIEKPFHCLFLFSRLSTIPAGFAVVCGATNPPT